MNVSFSAAIGNFDGVHKGHKKLLEKVKNDADKSGLKTKVLTFNPYPFEFFKWHKKRIINEFDKKEILKEIGIDEIVSIKFDEKFRNLKAEEFFELYIKKGKIKSLTVGNDFKFGKDRSGDTDLLRNLCKENDIAFSLFEDFKVDGLRVSSSIIREHLEKGKFVDVEKCLGRKLKFTGDVIHGKKFGTRISTPTANIDLQNKEYCFNGVFLCSVMVNDKKFFGIANFGTKPTFDDFRQSLEVHIFDFGENIYYQSLTIEFLFKIRDQIKFESTDDLKNQIHKDIDKAKSLIKDYE